MNYGDCLESAAAGLARSYAALRDPPPEDGLERAAAAVARARLYRNLEQQIVALGRVHGPELPPPGLVPTSDEWRIVRRNPVTALAISLRVAYAGTVAAWVNRADVPGTGPVALALRDAYQALQLAGDILTSHTGPGTGPAVAERPQTSEGMAVLAGVGRDDNLAAAAWLASAAADLDVRMVRWLWPEEAPADLRPLLAGAEQDVWRTKSGPLRETALLVAGGGHLSHAPALGLAAAPPIDDPLRWANLTSRKDCVTAVDAARSWLLRHGDELSVGQLVAAARAALATTRYIGHVYAHTSQNVSPAIDDLIAVAATPWRKAAVAAAELRSPIPVRDDHSTASVALTATARWLQAQLRPDGQWREPAPWAGDPAARVAWGDTAAELAARLPDLADLLHEAIGRSHKRGAVLAPTGGLTKRRGQLIRVPEWEPAPSGHQAYRALRSALHAAAAAGREFSVAAGVEGRPGLSDATTARARAYTRQPARLARQWYPAGASVASPTGAWPVGDGRQPRQLPPRPSTGQAASR